MAKTRWTRWVGIILAGIAAAVVLALVAIWLFVDANRYKPSLESAASRATGLTVRIEGPMRIVFFPPFGLSLSDVRITRGGHDVVRVRETRAGFRLLPLLWGRPRLRTLDFIRPAVVVRRTSRGPFPWTRYVAGPVRSARKALPGTLDHIARIAVSGGNVSYEAASSPDRAGVQDFSLALTDVVFRQAEDPFRTVSFRGTGKAASASFGDVVATGITFAVRAKNGNYELGPVGFDVFGGTGKADGWISVAEKTPLVHVTVSLPTVRAGDLSGTANGERGTLAGTLAFSASLFASGTEPEAMARTLTGDASWKGSDLEVRGFDPDALLSRAARNGHSLVRVAALLLPGPPLLGAARGLAGLVVVPRERAGQGRVATLVSSWTAKDGVFTAKDAALATAAGRVALAGGIDVARGRFEGLTAAVVDASGCAATKVAIKGPFRRPQVAKAPPAADRTTPGGPSPSPPGAPAPGTACEAFYAGAVPAPQ